MTKTAATAATADAKRPPDAGDAGPPAKRPRIADAGPSWSDLRPELIGHITRFLPMGTPDMMRLLLCVGPRVAAVVRKRYLTGNDYYLFHYLTDGTKSGLAFCRARECIGYWMQNNEKEWKKRCLGKTHQENVHSISLTPEHAKSLFLGKDEYFGIFLEMKASLLESSFLDEASIDVLTKFVKCRPDVFLLSVGDKDVDDGSTCSKEQLESLIDSTTRNVDGKISLCLMRWVDALFAYPQLFLGYDLVDVLRFMIEEKIIEPNMTITSIEEDYEDENRHEYTLLYLAGKSNGSRSSEDGFRSSKCFRHLLSLPGTDINAVASSREHEDGFRQYENIIHSCTRSRGSLHNLEAVLSHPDVSLDARTERGTTAFGVAVLELYQFPGQMAKALMLLEAGADPRISNNRGVLPLQTLDFYTTAYQYLPQANEEAVAELKLLREKTSERVQELNERDRSDQE